MDIQARFRTAVRRLVGLPDDPGQPPLLDHLALYRAQVNAASSAGDTLDLTPEDRRIPPHQQVPIRVGIPGAVIVVQAGAVVLLGWERGDPSRPYCVPSWEAGAGVQSLVLVGTAIKLGASSGLQPAVVGNDLTTRLQTIESAINNLTFLPNTEVVGTAGPYPVVATVGPKIVPPISNPPSVNSTVVSLKK